MTSYGLQDTFPLTGGREVLPLDSKTARSITEERHYLHKKPTVSHAYGLYEDGRLVGVITFGVPASRHLQTGVCPTNSDLVLELNRLWVDDAMPKNTESWFISRALKMLPARIVVSYADTAYGHKGYVYRATNFRYALWTDADRKTPRLDYVAFGGRHSRDAFRNGYAHTVRRHPKVKYWTTTGNRRERIQLAALCAWPSLDWREYPPPSEHQQLRIGKAA